MKISIVVPVYNMVDTIIATLESIWNQNYKDLELIIIDGNSTDGTKEYLKKYEDKIDILVSEKDDGQYCAIQKGMRIASGEILCWLNADDIYFQWTLEKVSQVFQEFPSVNWIAGIPAFLDSSGVPTHFYNCITARPQDIITKGGFRENVFGYLQQESMFWRRELWESVGGLDLKYKLAADFELWTRFAKKSSLTSVGLPLAGFRVHKSSRSNLLRDKYNSEVSEIVKEIKAYNIIEFLSKRNQIINKLVRLLTWRKTSVVFFSVAKNSWVKETRFRSLSNISLTQLLLEK